jgi:enamine deaminase RidA (YjgF/YER057c/UK114 family)
MTTAPIEARLVELGVEVGPAAPPLGSYAPVVVDGGLAYTSGVVALIAPSWDLLLPGRVGEDLDVATAALSARGAMLSTLANLRGALGTLDRVRRPLRVTGFVQAAPVVAGLPSVLNGATDLLAELFGPHALPARSAIGVAALPGGASVELECVFALWS